MSRLGFELVPSGECDECFDFSLWPCLWRLEFSGSGALLKDVSHGALKV